MKAAIPKKDAGGKVKIALPNVCERQRVHLINPVSGIGTSKKSDKYASICGAVEKSVAENGGKIIKSEHPGHIEELAAEACAKDPFVHIVAYGGDGTVYEVVNGMMKSGAASTASFSIVPVGSGNDFSAYANDSGDFNKSELNKIDLIRVKCGNNIRYIANMMNIGFDCSVVNETYTLKNKPFLRGSAAYIAGVAKTLIFKKPLAAKATLEGIVPFENCEKSTREKIENTEKEVFERDALLTLSANSRYCGGGFCAAPLASLTDGLMDVLFINYISRIKFISLVGAYKAGNYIDQNGVMHPQYDKILTYRKCKKMTIEGAAMYCLDGEIYKTDDSRTIEAEIVPSAVWYAAL